MNSPIFWPYIMRPYCCMPQKRNSVCGQSFKIEEKEEVKEDNTIVEEPIQEQKVSDFSEDVVLEEENLPAIFEEPQKNYILKL